MTSIYKITLNARLIIKGMLCPPSECQLPYLAVSNLHISNIPLMVSVLQYIILPLNVRSSIQNRFRALNSAHLIFKPFQSSFAYGHYSYLYLSTGQQQLSNAVRGILQAFRGKSSKDQRNLQSILSQPQRKSSKNFKGNHPKISRESLQGFQGKSLKNFEGNLSQISRGIPEGFQVESLIDSEENSSRIFILFYFIFREVRHGSNIPHRISRKILQGFQEKFFKDFKEYLPKS